MSAIGTQPNLFIQLQLPQFQLLQSATMLPPFALPGLLNAYDSAQSGLNPANSFIPPFMSMPSPASMMPMMAPIAGAGYAQNIDLAPFQPNDFLSRAFNPERREAANMERTLRTDPFARAAFESAVGGKIVDFGNKDDGRFTVERFTPNPYAAALGGGQLSPLASSIGGVYQQMTQGLGQSLSLGLGLGVAGAALGMLGGALGGGGGVGGGGSPFGQNPFLGLALGGLGGIASQILGGLGGGPGGFASFQGGVQGMPLFGMGSASWNPLAQPGKIQGSNAGREGAHAGQVHSILSDPSLTMEDKIMLALMVICQKMDDDIKRQTEYINQLQNQQGNRKKGGVGGPGGAGGAKAGGKMGGAGGQDGEKSIDVETKKLERMITKRSQLFDTLGKIMERYDQSAKNVIQSMRG